jgi:hypothetical protein
MVAILQAKIPKIYPDGPGTPPVYSSADIIAEYDSRELAEEFMQLSSRERRKGLLGGRSEKSETGSLRLYKHRPLNVEDEASISKARSILVQNRIWAASPASLNDSKDMSFKLVFNSDLKTRTKWAKEHSHLLNGLSPGQRLLRQKQLARMRMTSEMEIGLKQEIKRSMGVFCASIDPRNRLMWAHYAAEDRGICIQLAPYEDELFLIARKVIYNNVFPMLVVPAPPKATQEYYLHKSQDWAYEKEWRVVLPINNCSITLRPPAISAVILGARVKRETVEVVMSLLQERERLGKPPLKVYQAYLNDESFDIRIRSYDSRTVHR